LAEGATGALVAQQVVDVFLTAEHEGDRHQRRVDKMTKLVMNKFGKPYFLGKALS